MKKLPKEAEFAIGIAVLLGGVFLFSLFVGLLLLVGMLANTLS